REVRRRGGTPLLPHRAHRLPRRKRAGLGPRRRDGAPQAARARLRRPPGRERVRHRARGAGREERHPGDRPHERLRALRRRRPPHGGRRRRRTRGAGAAGPILRIAGLRHAVLRDVRALRRRLLQGGPAPLQPRGSLHHQPLQRQDVPRGPPGRRRRAPLVPLLRRRLAVALLSARRGWHTAELERALCARGHRARVLPFDGLRARIGAAPRLSAGGVSLDDVDAVLVRIIPRGSLEQIIFRVDALHRLVRAGIPVLNPPSAIERTVDKYYTSSLLEEAGIPTPYTV